MREKRPGYVLYVCFTKDEHPGRIALLLFAEQSDKNCGRNPVGKDGGNTCPDQTDPGSSTIFIIVFRDAAMVKTGIPHSGFPFAETLFQVT